MIILSASFSYNLFLILLFCNSFVKNCISVLKMCEDSFLHSSNTSPCIYHLLLLNYCVAVSTKTHIVEEISIRQQSMCGEDERQGEVRAVIF